MCMAGLIRLGKGGWWLTATQRSITRAHNLLCIPFFHLFSFINRYTIFALLLVTASYRHPDARTHACTHARMHARTHARMHARKQAHPLARVRGHARMHARSLTTRTCSGFYINPAAAPGRIALAFLHTLNALHRHRRWHVYCLGIDMAALKMTASARAFQRCVAHAQRICRSMSTHMPIRMPIHMSIHMSIRIRIRMCVDAQWLLHQPCGGAGPHCAGVPLHAHRPHQRQLRLRAAT